MISAGLDIGSRTVKLVVLKDGIIIHSAMRINTFEPLEVCRDILRDVIYDSLVATGYGRHLAGEHFNCEVISEIKAFALGTKAMFESARTILDIGGQDIKAISLDDSGKVRKFEMNDKCSAGTGKFLEIMAGALGCSLDSFASLAAYAGKPSKINSMCTVFAESEVVSLLSNGTKREEIALGIHHSVVNKAKSMIKRVGTKKDLVFVGGVALNSCIRALLHQSLGIDILTPAKPQTTGAYGCALYGSSL